MGNPYIPYREQLVEEAGEILTQISGLIFDIEQIMRTLGWDDDVDSLEPYYKWSEQDFYDRLKERYNCEQPD